jgi:type IV pilus assembly protein PilK
MTSLNVAVQVGELTVELVATIESRFSIQVNPERIEAFHFAANLFACEKFGSLAGLVHAIKRAGLNSEDWAQILHMATNHETRLFRHPASLEMVVKACKGRMSPKVLSVGCSTGEEAYSIAASLLRDGHPCFKITGVDISAPCIAAAKEGIYQAHPKLDSDVAAHIGGGKARIHNWIRAMVDFEVHNILASNPLPIRDPDVVITQNMLIYYRTETRHEILNRLAFEMPKGGHLIVGPAEDANWQNSAVRRLPYSNATVFTKD